MYWYDADESVVASVQSLGLFCADDTVEPQISAFPVKILAVASEPI